jgi:hypothetical protein
MVFIDESEHNQSLSCPFHKNARGFYRGKILASGGHYVVYNTFSKMRRHKDREDG